MAASLKPGCSKRLRAAGQESDAPAPRSLRREHARMGEGRARRQARGREIEHGREALADVRQRRDHAL